MVERIYLIRHGQPAAVWGGAEADPGLDDRGRAQARAARDWILGLPGAERPVRVVSSPLRRCLETAAPAADALRVGVVVVDAVGEVPTPAALQPQDRPQWLRQALQSDWSAIPGELDYDAWRRGVAAALPSLGGAAVFTHFVAINAVVSLLCGERRVLSFRPGHASVTVLETDGRGLSLVSRGAEAVSSIL